MAAQLQQEQALAGEQQPPQQQLSETGTTAAGSAAAEGYYSSLPAVAGRSLQRELQRELAAAVPEKAPTEKELDPVPVLPAQQESKLPAEGAAAATPGGDNAPGEEPNAAPAHYNTMPAAMGRTLRQQLSKELALEPPAPSSGSSRASSLEAGTAAAPGAAARGMRRPPRPGAIPPSSSLGEIRLPAPALPAHPAFVFFTCCTLDLPLPRPDIPVPVLHNPAEAPGRPAAAALVAAGQHPASARAPPRQAAPRPAGRRPAWEEYHATVTGAAGAPGLACRVPWAAA